MRILIVEPYFTGSHAAWAEGYQKSSRHDVDVLKLTGNFWKWRMHGGAVTLARRYAELKVEPDILVASDMLDLTTFLSLTRTRTAHVPAAVYFHENQLSYPWSPADRDVTHKRDKHYGFINYASALAADEVFFNSNYHLESFFEELDRLLRHFPDNNELGTVEVLRRKSAVLSLGMDLARFDPFFDQNETDASVPLLLWNHRWEYDKNPEDFFRALEILADRGVQFRLAVLGENFSQVPDTFLRAKEVLGGRVVQFGYAEDFESYARWLHRADILPVTSYQDFFGASIVEAIYCGCRPLLPRRLAYPELIPPENHDNVFYDDFDDFISRLESILRAGKSAPAEGLSAAMARFDWNAAAPLYDNVLGELTAAKGGSL